MSHEILMFVCLQKDTKQFCEVTTLHCTFCSDHRSMSAIDHGELTALFCVFL